jgi:hypothetical protein
MLNAEGRVTESQVGIWEHARSHDFTLQIENRRKRNTAM